MQAAVGEKRGIAKMQVSHAHVFSSLSSEWMESVAGSRRCKDVVWQSTIDCEVTTLDLLIAQFGRPAFIKIDVEGYELQVLKGLSESVAALSFEYTPEMTRNAWASIDHLEQLGLREFNYSVGESMEFSGPWCSATELRPKLPLAGDDEFGGDIYARRV